MNYLYNVARQSSNMLCRATLLPSNDQDAGAKMSLWQEVQHETYPAVKHTCSVVILVLCVLVVGLLAELLKWCLGDHVAMFTHALAFIDMVAGLGTLGYFSVVMFVALTELTFAVLAEAWPGKLCRWFVSRWRKRQ